MKKIILGILTVLLCMGGVASTYFLLDHSAPVITVDGKPSLACKTTFDGLMRNASAYDDKELKSFFIEEKDLYTIADNGYLTYVAVDSSNHVTKKQVTVNVTGQLKEYHLEIIQPLLFQVKESAKIEDYVRLKNGCGWDIKDKISMEGVNFDKTGEYHVLITSKKHGELEPLEADATVIDFSIPRIIFENDVVEDTAGKKFDEEYFLKLVKSIEDDKDSENQLRETLTCDYLDVLPIYESGLINRAGTYTITYTVTDSDGKSSSNSLTLKLSAPKLTVSEPVQESGQEAPAEQPAEAVQGG